MPRQSIIWTVLPNGMTRDGKSLRLSLLASPRLEPETQPAVLASFPDFVSWPKTLSGTIFTLHVGSNTSTIVLDASNVDATIGTADDVTWNALFPDSTSVLPQKLPDRSNNTVVSYDTVGLHDAIAETYATLTAAPNVGLPSITQLIAKLEPIIANVKRIDDEYFDQRQHARDLSRMFDDYKSGKLEKYDSDGLPLAAFQMFHTPPNAVKTETFAPAYDPRLKVRYQNHVSKPMDIAKAVADIDFHQIVAAMNQYPTLLRRLGLVLDFVVPAAKVPVAANFTMWVTAKLPSAFADADAERNVRRRDALPVTHVRHSNSMFAPITRPGSNEEELAVQEGMLHLSKRFALLQMDVDGSGHKVINFARTLAHHLSAERQVDPLTKLPRLAGAPALRNAGLMLVHRKRGVALQSAFVRNTALNDNIKLMFAGQVTPASALYAEDLVRGWRIDIWDKSTGKWCSLCERVANYDINKGTVVLSGIQEEGMIRLAATSSTDGTNPDAVYLHEALTVWNGWSLVAQQPGKAIDRNDKELRDATATVPDGVRLQTHFVPRPGSLPKLRYGHVYALRARAVDLAGNSLKPNAANYPGDDSAIAAAAPYFRFEPIQPPGFALVGTKAGARLPLAGESMARSVVRSFNDRFDDTALSTQEAQRWAIAARTSQREAELHGVLDGAQWGTAAQYALLSERDAELAQYDVVPGADEALTGPVIALPGSTKPANRPTRPIAGDETDRPEKSRSMSYAVLPADSQSLPFLPDPLCTRILVRLIHHPLISSLEPIVIPMYRDGKQWPDIAPLLIRVYEANDEVPRFDVATHTLLIPTPKATRATLSMSTMMEDDTLKFMGVWNWVKESARDEALKRRARAGQLWSLTPAREMEIVHAVQRPLLKPDILNFGFSRPPGATWITPTVSAICHRDSTIKLDLRAAWHDARDAGITPPSDQTKEAVPFSIKITDPQGYAGVVEHIMPDAGPENAITFGEVKVTDEDLIQPKVHDFGDTRYRRVEYQLTGTTRFREYMPSELLYGGGKTLRTPTDKHLTLDGSNVVKWVLSSASPPAPEVLYVVPTFGWTRGVDADGRTASWRQGGGLRVWLDRPWNTTGYGEMLAVVLPQKESVTDPNKPPYKHTVTQWGNDPIWASPFVQGVAPVAENFPLRRTKPDTAGTWLPPGAVPTEADQPHNNFATQALTHPGLPLYAATGRVDVVPHDVFWDQERGLWYCDIEITHGSSYFPFVRLALARYQPSSIPEQYLSNVVMADFCALAPNRWLTVSSANPTRRSVKVFGSAPVKSSGYDEAYQHRTETRRNGKVLVHLPVEISKSNFVEVWVEKLTVAQGEDFGWHKISDGTESAWQATTQTTNTAPAQTPVNTNPARPAVNTTPVVNRSNVTAQQKLRADELMTERNFQAVLQESLVEATYEWPSLWTGSIDLPTAPSATARYRVVVAEYEEYLSDGADVYAAIPSAVTRRLVFVEHVELL